VLAGNWMNFVVYAKDATANVAAGVEWVTDKPTISWTAGQAFYAASWTLAVYRKPSGAITVIDGKARNNAQGAGYITDSLTALAGASLLITGAAHYDWSFQTGSMGPPAAQALRYKRNDRRVVQPCLLRRRADRRGRRDPGALVGRPRRSARR
jgi:hypothetical protein